jgi:ABC-2 type transport system permease protein
LVQPGGNVGLRVNYKDIYHPTAREVFYGSFGNGVMEILMAVLVGALVAAEYSSCTIKNMLAYGKRREYYYISKFIAISVGLVIIFSIIVAISTVGSAILFGWGVPFGFNQAVNILKVFLAAIAVGMGTISLLMLLATLVKSNGSTIGIGIVVLTLLPTIFAFLYGKYTWLDKIYESTLPYNWALATAIRTSNWDVLKAAAIGIIILLIAGAWGIMVLKKQDIK